MSVCEHNLLGSAHRALNFIIIQEAQRKAKAEKLAAAGKGPAGGGGATNKPAGGGVGQKSGGAGSKSHGHGGQASDEHLGGGASHQIKSQTPSTHHHHHGRAGHGEGGGKMAKSKSQVCILHRFCIIESIDSISRDDPDTPIYVIHYKK